MTSPNETDRKLVRSVFLEWGNPQTAIALLHMGYDRDMVREEFKAYLDKVLWAEGRPESGQ